MTWDTDKSLVASNAKDVLLPTSASTALEQLRAFPQVERIILFGSRAIGDHDDRSDVDVAISAPTLDKESLIRIRDSITYSKTLYKISISLLETMPDRLRASVLQTGVTIYEREKIERQLR